MQSASLLKVIRQLINLIIKNDQGTTIFPRTGLVLGFLTILYIFLPKIVFFNC